MDGYYNYRVTGNALLMPYSVYFREYRFVSPWLLARDSSPPVYRHSDLENTWRAQELGYRAKRSSVAANLRDFREAISFFLSPLYVFPIAIAIMLSRSRQFWIVAFMFCCSASSLLIETFKAPHYIAGSVGVLPLLVLYGLRWLRVISREYGPLLVLTLVALFCLQGNGLGGATHWDRNPVGFRSPRLIAAKGVMKEPGNHLIIVRHSKGWIENSDECVFNGADIDSEKIIFARDMGEQRNRELIDYYRGTRMVWLYEPEADPVRLTPLSSASD